MVASVIETRSHGTSPVVCHGFIMKEKGKFIVIEGPDNERKR